MAWLYLMFALASVALTVNAFRPLKGGPRLNFMGFFSGWLWGELALHAIALQIGVTWLAALLGGLDSWPGHLGLLAVIGSCVALGRGYMRGRHAAPAVEQALRTALGEDYAERVVPELGQHFEYGTRWRPILRPFPIRHPEVECLRDIEFSRERGVTLRLDLYRNRSAPAGCPTLLQIHGGAWVIGDKREQGLPLMHQLAARGWVCVSANYRLSPHATFPEHLIDLKRAIRWIRESGAPYGANPDFLVVTGGSAGGHLAALVGLTANDPAYQPGFEHVDTSVRAAVPIYGVYDFTDRHGVHSRTGMVELLEKTVMKGSFDELTDLYRQASPLDLVHEAAPPFFVIHGDLDSLVPVEAARRFVSALRERSSAPVAYAEIPGAQHAFDLFPSLRAQIVVDAVERFVASVYSRHANSAASAQLAVVATHAPAPASAPAEPAVSKPVRRTRATPRKKRPAAKRAPRRRSAAKSKPPADPDSDEQGEDGETTSPTISSNGRGEAPLA